MCFQLNQGEIGKYNSSSEDYLINTRPEEIPI
jgi:hypothetical protein